MENAWVFVKGCLGVLAIPPLQNKTKLTGTETLTGNPSHLPTQDAEARTLVTGNIAGACAGNKTTLTYLFTKIRRNNLCTRL